MASRIAATSVRVFAPPSAAGMRLSISKFIVADLLRSPKDRGGAPNRAPATASATPGGPPTRPSARESVRALKKVGFDVIRQKGSHTTLHNPETDKTTLVARCKFDSR
ncbi:MAG: hypothetical protein CR217_05620 [Beijerinckiaceae bacterium]|nr:MAG: hypothetical protein CR217_05620 [Beijerinckiaceae bacterium]